MKGEFRIPYEEGCWKKRSYQNIAQLIYPILQRYNSTIEDFLEIAILLKTLLDMLMVFPDVSMFFSHVFMVTNNYVGMQNVVSP